MTGNTFPRTARLLNAKQYGNVFSDTKIRASSKSVLILATPNQLAPLNSNMSDVRKNTEKKPLTSTPRVGIIAAKKHLKRAVDRNRFKRVVRETFRQRKDRLDCLDIVVLARAGISVSDTKLLASDLERLLKVVEKKLLKHRSNIDQ